MCHALGSRVKRLSVVSKTLSVDQGNPSVAFALLSVTSDGLSVALVSFRRSEDFIRRSGESFRRFRFSIRHFRWAIRRLGFFPSFRRLYPSIRGILPSLSLLYPSPFLLFVDPRKLSLAFALLSVTLKSLSILLINSSFFFPQKNSQLEADYMLIDMDVWFLFAGIFNDQCLWTVY